MDMITMSSKGQFVIPKDIREEMGIKKNDRFVIAHDRENILLKKIRQDDLEKTMTKLLDRFSEQFRKAGIKEENVEKEIKEARKDG